MSLVFLAALAPMICTVVLAQNTNTVAEREAARRQAALPRGQEALGRAKAAMAEGNYTVAHEEFRVALTFLPDALVSEKSHDEAVTGFCASGMKLAEQKVAEGKFGEAEAICREILSNRYDPNCRPAAEMLARLQSPGTVNRTVGPKFISKVEEVKKLLVDAEGYYMSGRYDLAFKKYEQILALDPYNVAARRGEERINLTKTHYGEEAYNETRSRQLWQVQKAWEEPIKKYGDTVVAPSDIGPAQANSTSEIAHKLNSIIIPKIDFNPATFGKAIDQLRQMGEDNDRTSGGPRGVNIVLRERRTPDANPPVTAPALPGEAPANAAASLTPAAATPTELIPVRLQLTNVSLYEALRYTANQAGFQVKLEPSAVLIIPINDETKVLITKRYRIPADFFAPMDIGYFINNNTSGATQSNPDAQAVSPPLLANNMLEERAAEFSVTSGAGDTKNSLSGKGTTVTRQQLTNGRQLVARAGAMDYLKSMGVSFPPGASATFLPQSATLIVRNTQENLDFVDALVEQANVSRPKQVEIEAKFVEITQTNLKELGFDWLLGPFNIDSRIQGTGGVPGNGAAVLSPNYPFLDANGNPVGRNPVTAGNRSGGFAINGSAIDSLLGNNVATNVAPGVFGFGGLLTNPQFQVVVRALNQKKGVDLLSAPRITTKSGQRAVIEIVREFRYPTSFNEPKVPDISGRGSSNSTSTTIALPVVGPSTPKDFATRNTGVTLEVEPIVGTDGVTIDLNLVPEVTEFEGFINYGSPINTVNPALLGFLGIPTGLIVDKAITLTDNVINQPIFSTRKVTTSVSVWDGQTVVIGGLMREDVQKTEDRTPILGDIPIVGRLFRTTAEQHMKRNLIIFVTAHLINPDGFTNPAEDIEESEDVIEQPILPEVPFYKK